MPGQAAAPVTPLNEHDTELHFQLLELLRHGRLRKAELACRLDEASGFCERHERGHQA
jgi:hypothetical protein